MWSYQGTSSAFTDAWSPDGRFIAIGDADGTVQVRNAMTGTLTLSLNGDTQAGAGGWPVARWQAPRLGLLGFDRAGLDVASGRLLFYLSRAYR